MALWQGVEQAKEVAKLSTTEIFAFFLLLALGAIAWLLKEFLKREYSMVSLLLQASAALGQQIEALKEIPRALENSNEYWTEQSKQLQDAVRRIEEAVRNCPGSGGPGPPRR